MLGAQNFLNICESYYQDYFEKSRDFGKIVEFHLNVMFFSKICIICSNPKDKF